MYLWIVSTVMGLLAGCSSAPQPPTVDGSDRQNINTIEMQKRMTHCFLSKNKRQQQTETIDYQSVTHPQSQIIRIHFSFNSARFQLDTVQSIYLLSSLAGAQRINIRGRTDDQRSSIADEKVALNRAMAVQRYLIEQGVTPDMMSINYLSAGDYIGDNTSKLGRSMNRRVDIEILYQ